MQAVLSKQLHNEDIAKLCLRLAVGFLMLFHGFDKLVGGIEGLEGLFASKGLPSVLAYGVYIGEVIAPILLIVGLHTRIASLLVAGTMVVAIFMAHSADIFTLTKHGAWTIELQMFYILGCISIFFHGSGKYSIDKN